MALNPRPVRLSEEVNERLSYTINIKIDEFTLKKYQLELEKLLDEGIPEAEDFIALGKVYFNQKKYNKFLSLMEKGLSIYKNRLGLEHYMMGKMMISDRNLYPLKSFNIFDEWFNNEYNPNNAPLSFNFSHDYWLYLNKRYDFEKEVVGNISINFNQLCNIEVGPFRVVEKYDHFKKEGCDFFNHIFKSFIDKLCLEIISQDEEGYFKEILGEKNFMDIRQRAFNLVKRKRKIIKKIPGLNRPLRKEVPIIITVEEGQIFVSNPELQIFESGQSLDEALSEFYDFFILDYENWIDTPEQDLTSEAKAIKEKYLELVES